jgi:PAS domain S-box-containing protein
MLYMPLPETAEIRMSLIVDAAPNAVLLVDDHGRIALANAQAEKLFGYGRGELLGRPVDLLVPVRLQGGHAEKRDELFRHPSPRPMGAGRDVYGRRQDGTEIPLEIGLSPVETAEGVFVVASMVDLTLRKHTEEVLVYERNLLRALIDNLPDLIYIKDTERRFLAANTAVASVMGAASPNDLLGKRDEDFYPELAAAEFRVDDEQVLRGAPLLNKEEPRTDHQGVTLQILTTKIPLRDRSGTITGLVGISRDITELKRKEQALQEAREHVKTLRGLLPICAFCHKIRKPDGSWERLETYIRTRTEADFTHGFCPECLTKHYGAAMHRPPAPTA